MSKDALTISDISEAQNILVSTETKLTNLDEWDRYVIGKYYVWVEEYAKRYRKSLEAEAIRKKNKEKGSKRTEIIRKEISKDYTAGYKFLVHIYCYLIRTPLSVEGAAFDRLTQERKEIEYRGGNTIQAQQPEGTWRG